MGVLLVLVWGVLGGLCQGVNIIKSSGYLDLIQFEDPTADDSGFRIHMKTNDSGNWKHILDTVTLSVGNGNKVQHIQKKMEFDVSNEKVRWIDFTNVACDRKTKSLTISFYDLKKREKQFSISSQLLFGQESIKTSVSSVYPDDVIKLWTKKPAKMHCFHGGSVTISKNGVHLNETDIEFSDDQYTITLNDAPVKNCQNTKYDLTINSRFGWDLGVGRIRKKDNKVNLVRVGKNFTVNTLDGFLYCTSKSASVVEVVSDPIGLGIRIQSDEQRHFSLQQFLGRCMEAVLKVEYQENGDHLLDIINIPRNIKVGRPSKNMREIKILDEDFQNCANMNTELQCQEEGSDNFVSVQNYTANYNDTTATTFSVKEYLHRTCRIRQWIDARYLQYAMFHTILDPLTTTEWIIIGVAIGIFVLIIGGVGAVVGRKIRAEK